LRGGMITGTRLGIHVKTARIGLRPHGQMVGPSKNGHKSKVYDLLIGLDITSPGDCVPIVWCHDNQYVLSLLDRKAHSGLRPHGETFSRSKNGHKSKIYDLLIMWDVTSLAAGLPIAW
jgi:hypothetical protein